MKVMSDKSLNNLGNCRARRAVVLLVTLVLLVVLSTLGYTLTSRLAARRHRDRYIIDYQMARYGCESAVKYAFARLQDINPRLVARPEEPDFSDLFALSEEEYNQLLEEWADERALRRQENFDDNLNDSNFLSESNDTYGVGDFNDPNFFRIRGPYGPPWPFVTEPVEFELGSATVRIEIEDENAKYPLGWAMLSEGNVQREAVAGFEAFCEWMNINTPQINSLKTQLDDMGKIKAFKLNFKPIVITQSKVTRRPAKSRRGRKTSRTVTVRTTSKKTIPATVHTADFAKLFHSTLIDTELLAMPTVISERRKESALKYMGMWGSGKVNINTAPRQVLEAVFTFGGDADKIAEEIIQRRRIKPFTSVKELKQSLFRYADSIEKCQKYITTVSSFFTIKVTAVSGVAEASAVIAITKDGTKISRVAVISG